MDLKKFLDSEKLINTAELARQMWPDNKSAKSKLSNKLKEKVVGNGKQRVTEKDNQVAKRILDELADRIKKL